MSKKLELNDLFNSSSSIRKNTPKADVQEEAYNSGGEVIEEIPDDFDDDFDDGEEEMQIPDDMEESDIIDDYEDDAVESPVAATEPDVPDGDDEEEPSILQKSDNEDEFEEYDSDANEKVKRDKAARNIVNGITQDLLSRGKPQMKAGAADQEDDFGDEDIQEEYIPDEDDGTYDPNYDHYYDDVLPEIEAEIQRIDAWLILKAAGIVALVFLVIAYFIFYM